MNISLKKVSKSNTSKSHVSIYNSDSELKNIINSKALRLTQKLKKKPILSLFNGEKLICLIKAERSGTSRAENLRKAGHKVWAKLKEYECTDILVSSNAPEDSLNLIEGIILSTYRFDKYLSTNESFFLKIIKADCAYLDQSELNQLISICKASFITRDLVNEPPLRLTPEIYSSKIKSLGKKFGFKTDVYKKSKIEALKMGGLLAVNMGSEAPPTFNIMEWKPKNPINKAPIILVGKGVVYDTGGLSLKPTPNSMDLMKSDMAGSAAVVGTFCAISELKTPVHIIGLIAATDNRPGKMAYAPGDVIQMHNGSTVEVLNTDAEGRMTLADALSYAKKYKPELVIDIATLTGAASRAIGQEGLVFMGTASEETKKQITDASNEVYERLVEFPLWEEYGEQIKSDIADLKNIGGPNAGHITAGKFLEAFTDYPWLHIDIAGSAFLTSEDSYRGKHATGSGVRLLTQFLKSIQ